MKALIKVEKEFDIKYLIVDAGVRYWEDSEINGEQDNDIYDNPELGPKMPFAVLEYGIKDQWRWKFTIDIDNKMILGWPSGVVADVHYKVCDDGKYTLTDSLFNKIVEVESYVPECLCPAENGYGDYIIMHINEDGIIDGFDFTQEDIDEIIENDFNYERE